MSDETNNPSGRRHTSRRRRRAASRMRRAGFAAGGLALLVASGLLLGGLTGKGLPGGFLVFSGDDSAAPGESSSTTSSTAAGAIGSGAGAGRPDSSSPADGDGGLGTAGGDGTKGGGVHSPSTPADPSKPTQPSTPADPGTPTSPTSPTTPTNPGEPAPPRALPDAEKLAAAAITAGDMGGGWKQIAAGAEGIGFACDAGRTVTGDTTASRALRRPGVTVTNHNFGYNGTGAADTFGAYRAAAVGCNGWKISEYARSLDISVKVTEDTPQHLVVSYEIKDRGHPTVYQVEHLVLAGNTLGIVSMETTAVPNKDLLTTLTGGVDAVAARLAALGV